LGEKKLQLLRILKEHFLLLFIASSLHGTVITSRRLSGGLTVGE
jgi:hypothetical protein